MKLRKSEALALLLTAAILALAVGWHAGRFSRTEPTVVIVERQIRETGDVT